MKINAVLLIVFIVSLLNFSCGNSSVVNKKNSKLHALIDTLNIDKTKNIIIYTVNPNDCFNCLIGFVNVNNTLSKIQNSKIYILAVEREIEKQDWIKTLKNIDLKDSVNRVVIWDKTLFNTVNKLVRKELPLSLVIIYNYTNDSIIYNAPIKEIVEVEQIMRYLN